MHFEDDFGDCDDDCESSHEHTSDEEFDARIRQLENYALSGLWGRIEGGEIISCNEMVDAIEMVNRRRFRRLIPRRPIEDEIGGQG